MIARIFASENLGAYFWEGLFIYYLFIYLFVYLFIYLFLGGGGVIIGILRYVVGNLLSTSMVFIRY